VKIFTNARVELAAKTQTPTSEEVGDDRTELDLVKVSSNYSKTVRAG
jgi:hypothetical protein